VTVAHLSEKEKDIPDDADNCSVYLPYYEGQVLDQLDLTIPLDKSNMNQPDSSKELQFYGQVCIKF